MGNALNNIWTEHKDKFKEWLLHKNISNCTKRDYLSALTKFFENHLVYKPMEFRSKQLKDKEERGLRNLFSYFEDEEIDNICGYNLEKWRRYVKIKKSGVVEVYVFASRTRIEICTKFVYPAGQLLRFLTSY